LEARFTEGDNNSVSISPVPFAPEEHWRLSPLGYVIHGISDRYAVTLLRRDDIPLRIERSYEPIPTAGGERAEEEARMTRNMRYTDPNWRWSGPPIPDYKPPYRQIYAGEDGTIWLLLSQPAARVEDPGYDPTDPESVPDEWREPVVFDVFQPDGGYLGAVRAPDGFSPYPQPTFARDWVLAVVRDEFDVQTVTLFTVEHRAGAQTEQE
jgi:hypothetical protein